MTEAEKIKEFLKSNGYKMTLVTGSFQYWSHLEKPAIWFRDSVKPEIFVQIPDIYTLEAIIRFPLNYGVKSN